MFESSSEQTKRVNIKNLRDSVPASFLTYSTIMRLKPEGKSQASKVLKKITTTSPKHTCKCRKCYRTSLEPQQQMSGEAALALLVEAKLSIY